MKRYWSYKSIPELADLPKEKRKDIWQSCRLKRSANLPFGCSTDAITVVWLVIVLPLGTFYSNNHIIGLIWAVLVSAIIGFSLRQVEIALVKPYIREYLNPNVKTN
jgi:hypothetical protein